MSFIRVPALRQSSSWAFASRILIQHESFVRNYATTATRKPICPGCGSTLTNDPRKPGYVEQKPRKAVPLALVSKRLREQQAFQKTLESLDEETVLAISPTNVENNVSIKTIKQKSLLCTRCHSLLHHSSIPQLLQEEKASTFDIYSKIRQDPDALVVNVIDVMDFPLSLLSIRKHIGTRPRIIHVFSRLDILYRKPLLAQEARERLSRMLESCLNEDGVLDARIISALKGWEVASLANSLRTRRKGTNIYFVGSANAGKSSLIATLGRRSKMSAQQMPVVSHLPGTTLASIPTEIELFGDVLGRGRGSVVDLPGVLEPGFSNFIKPEALQKSLPHKHIKARPFSLKQGESLIIGDLIQVELISGEPILVTPFTQLGLHTTSRPEYILSKPSDVRKEDCPAFQTALEETFEVGLRGGDNVADLVFKDLGFISVAMWKGKAHVRVKTPGGLYSGIRLPALFANPYDKQ